MMVGGVGGFVLCWGEGVFVSRENFRMVVRERKKWERDKGRGILTARRVSSGLCCSSRTSTETKVVITTDY